ncbi:MAG: single-stranded DNA-binding protein [Candidatus Taylorbacteria bacterium]
MYINKALVYGNLTRDPELRSLPSGVQVASFSLATNRVYKDKEGNKKEQAEFHNIVLFAKLGELAAQYLKKGSPVYIEGRMQTRSWEADGVKKYRTEIVGDTMQFGPRPAGGGAPRTDSGSAPASPATSDKKAKPADAIEYPQEEINPDDIPF